MYYFQFGIYFFSFLLTESVINDRAVDIVGVDYVNLIYAIGLFCTVHIPPQLSTDSENT